MTALAHHQTTTAAPPDPTRTAVRDIIPVIVGVVPFAITIGVAISLAPIGDLAGWAGGPLIAAGAAHITVVGLAGTEASNLAIVATALLINARLAAYSATLAPVFRDQPRWFRWLAPQFVVDQTFILADARRGETPAWMRRYWFVMVGALYSAWVVAITVGLFAGPIVPQAWQLGFAVPVMFAGMAAPSTKGRPAVHASLVGGVCAALFAGLPSGLGLIVAIVAGTAAGAVTERASS